MGIEIRDLLAIRGPPRHEVETGLVLEPNRPRGFNTHRVAHVHLVFAAPVGEVRDPLSIGRPGRVAFHHAGGLRQIPRVTLLRRDGHDLPTCFKQRTGTGWRDVRVGEPGADVDVPRPQLRHVPGECDGDRRQRARLDVVQLELTELLDHDAARTCRGGFEVHGGV